MKTVIRSILVFAIVLLTPQILQAQGTLFISNLQQTPTGSAVIGSNSWIAQSVITGTNPNGYTLNSIQLLMNAPSGSPGGFDVSIYSSFNGQPQNNLGNLVGSEPLSGGIFDYTASSLDLSSSTPYFVVVSAATPVTQGAYNWSGANGPTYFGDQRWAFPNTYYSSTDGSSWSMHGRENIFQMAIYATPVPEPGVLSLLGLSGLAFLWQHRKNAPPKNRH